MVEDAKGPGFDYQLVQIIFFALYIHIHTTLSPASTFIFRENDWNVLVAELSAKQYASIN